jgi:sec-independent protein translocase protein TatB
MLDVAWPELVVIGVVALVAIGPKDLPKVMHTLGQWASKARGFSHDMRRAFEQVSFESEQKRAESEQKKAAPSSSESHVNTPPLSSTATAARSGDASPGDTSSGDARPGTHSAEAAPVMLPLESMHDKP